ncbi:MAG: spermine synthase, partial [Burkholderiaceae bacterium]|nr:spermine synthase [Burkholderiaceae bacterium]
MIPFRNLAEVFTPDGSRLSLHEHDGDYFMKLNGRQLMSSTSTTSEILLADKACLHLARRLDRRVLIGGLGLGFSLKRVLEMIGKSGVVHVAEVLPEVVAWNRDLLAELNGEL